MESLVKLAKKNKQKRHIDESLLISGQSLHDKSNSSHSSGSKNTSYIGSNLDYTFVETSQYKSKMPSV